MIRMRSCPSQGELQTVPWFQFLPIEPDASTTKKRSSKAEQKDALNNIVLSAYLHLQNECFLSIWTNSFVGPWDPSQGVSARYMLNFCSDDIEKVLTHSPRSVGEGLPESTPPDLAACPWRLQRQQVSGRTVTSERAAPVPLAAAMASMR
ncbi:unnamed protein product [Urochloa humidicola]